MGVPAFFRWLSKKYSSIIVDAVEEKNRGVDGVKVPVDATQKNPNFQEFDNLYLDMNGIIHPCTHPEDRPAPKTEDEMFILIFEYIDRLFSIVRPRRVLYMAIDGVAPRAKMNQQRSRRFRAAKEAFEKKEIIKSIRNKLESEGVPLPPPKKEEEHFDSNCITPGTPFMDRLAVALRYYIHKRIATEPAWQSIQVILSDANAPGEGEHKIMDYIRRQRASSSHDPNTVHCLCGADADLIMLGLATHEANFNILREEFVPNQPSACELCGQYGHELKDCKGLVNKEAGPDQADPLKKEKNFIFIRLPVLREYLEKELAMPNLPFKYDFERAIDDWVFMCFFVGNDFLPHLPSLEIRENAIDRLIKLYKNVVYTTKGWLTKSGEVYLDRVQKIMIELGKVEDEIFKIRQIKELKFRQINKNRRQQERDAAQRNRSTFNSSNDSFNTPPMRPYDRNRNSSDSGANSLMLKNRFSLLAAPFVPAQANQPVPLSSLNLSLPNDQNSGYGAPPSLLQQVDSLSETISKAPIPPNFNEMDASTEETKYEKIKTESDNDQENECLKDEQMITDEMTDDKQNDSEIELKKKTDTQIEDVTKHSSSDATASSTTSTNLTISEENIKAVTSSVPKGGPAFVPETASLIQPLMSKPAYISGAETRKLAAQDRLQMQQRCAEASARLKAILLPAGSKRPASSIESPNQNEPHAKSFKEASSSRSANQKQDDEDDVPNDEIRLWESGWKERYYQMKFGVSESDVEFRRKVAWAYAEGLCWVLKYYYQGCASWNWYYPYHYAPFASDFDTIANFKPDFSKHTEPFKPLEQLMGVFPAASRSHIPESWRWLMTDENSPIFDFYPKDFEIDLNGKKYAWQGVALLPFVDERRLLEALVNVYPKLTSDEKRRNGKGPDRLFVGQNHPLFSSLVEVYNTGKANGFEEMKDDNGNVVREWIYVDNNAANGMSGEMSWDKDAIAPGVPYPSLFSNSLEFNDVKSNACMMVVYRDPQFPQNFIFEACRLDGIKELDRVLKPSDWDERRNGQFRPQIGFSRDIPTARLSTVGHRILNHSMHYQNASPVAPDGSFLQPLNAAGGANWRMPTESWRSPNSYQHPRHPLPIPQPYPLVPRHQQAPMPLLAQGYASHPQPYNQPQVGYAGSASDRYYSPQNYRQQQSRPNQQQLPHHHQRSAGSSLHQQSSNLSHPHQRSREQQRQTLPPQQNQHKKGNWPATRRSN